MQYTTIFTKEDKWGYTVEVLELPWCLSYGKNIEEAEEMIKDAIYAYLESAKKHPTKKFSIQKKFISSIVINDFIQT